MARVNLVNLTPHEIVFVRDGKMCTISLARSGRIAWVFTKASDAPPCPLTVDMRAGRDCAIPLMALLEDVANLPQPCEGTMYVVEPDVHRVALLQGRGDTAIPYKVVRLVGDKVYVTGLACSAASSFDG